MPRKNPYSGKQKKQQLKDKKARKQDGPKYLADSSDDDDEHLSQSDKGKCEAGALGGVKDAPFKLKDSDVNKINEQPESSSTFSVNSFRLHFLKESKNEIEKRKKKARRPIKCLHENDLEYGLQDVYPSHVLLNFPKRPEWSYDLSKEELENQERQYFKDYLSGMMSQPHAEDLSFFDLNIENWRQLWRVIEISDILLIIADIRYPVLHASPSLINYAQTKLHKSVIIVLNKIDFVPPVIAVSWKHYLQSVFPGIHVVFFSSFVRKSGSVYDSLPIDFNTSKAMYRKPPKGSSSPLGPAELYEAVLKIVEDKVDLSSWKQHLEEEEMFSSHPSEQETQSQNQGKDVTTIDKFCEDKREGHDESKPIDRENIKSKKYYKDGIVTIGCVGYPNVGKSSVLNALKGKKVVSVSVTPGHTKHLQTIFLSPTVKLCDCPGLVFPSVVPKALQIIAGIFPVAQVKEPYSVIQYLAERIDLPALLRIHPPEDHEGHSEEYAWSAYDICEAWAVKCGFVTSKAARPDLYRAANKILRLAVEGQLRLCFRPPDYSCNLDAVKSHPETLALHSLLTAGTQACHRRDGDEDEDSDEDSSHDDEEDDDVEDFN